MGHEKHDGDQGEDRAIDGFYRREATRPLACEGDAFPLEEGLFNVREDAHQEQNLAKEHLEMLEELRQDMLAYFREERASEDLLSRWQ